MCRQRQGRGIWRFWGRLRLGMAGRCVAGEDALSRPMRGARPGKPGRQTAGASSRTPHD